jgi:hypothetical protein
MGVESAREGGNHNSFNSMYGMHSMTSYLVPLFPISIREFCKICRFKTLVTPFTSKKCSGCGNNYD